MDCCHMLNHCLEWYNELRPRQAVVVCACFDLRYLLSDISHDGRTALT